MLLRTSWQVKCVFNSCIAPKLPENKDKDFLKKKTYGKVPKYLEKHKKEIEDEY